MTVDTDGGDDDATNQRRALVVDVDLAGLQTDGQPGPKAVTVVNVHLTYHDLGQCDAVAQLAVALDRMAAEAPETPQILLGDMNTYLDYPW